MALNAISCNLEASLPIGLLRAPKQAPFQAKYTEKQFQGILDACSDYAMCMKHKTLGMWRKTVLKEVVAKATAGADPETEKLLAQRRHALLAQIRELRERVVEALKQKEAQA